MKIKYSRYVYIKFESINHNFKLEFVDSGLYFVQDISVATGS